jgi:hypothetical protein
MPRSAENGGRYEVHCSGLIAKRLKEIQKHAKEEGRGEHVLSAIRNIWHRLSDNPIEFGEPLYRLPALRMQVRHGIIRPLFVEFAVCEDEPLVFIKGITLLPAQAK